MSKKPLLSIGMIVKNEIRCLEKCLKALQPLRDALPCELVIADTGSTDGTREIAEKYADILIDFEWINDFAAARNAVLDRCTGKWYLTVDADEYLRLNTAALKDSFALMERNACTAGFIVVRNYETPDMQGDYMDFAALRLAKRTPDLRYHGTIHESFNIKPDDRVFGFNVNDIILDHDGYCRVDKEHLAKKAERNMKILEREWEKDTKNLRRLNQCIESCVNLPEKREKFIYVSMQEIMKEDHAPQWDIYAPSIARKAIELAHCYGVGDVDEWILWARKTFPDSLYIQIDVGYYHFARLLDNERYDEAIEIGLEYLRGVARYREVGPTYAEIQHSPIYSVRTEKQNGLRLALSRMLQQEKRDAEALEVLDDVRTKAKDHKTILLWLGEVERNAQRHECMEMVTERLGPFFQARKLTDAEKHTRQLILERAKKQFSKPENGQWKLYRKLTKDLALCASLLEAEEQAEASALLADITDWSEILPMPLAHAMELGAELPESFYHMDVGSLHGLIDKLAKTSPAALMRYTAPEHICDWHHLCFAYDALCALCMHGGTNIYSDSFTERFAQIGALFLSEYYNPNVLANENAIDRLPVLHRFTWHYVRAVELRWENDWTGYIAGLRKAVAEVNVMKQFVHYLLSDVQERWRREQIANASPELIALAEQVKTILAQYPTDDPAVAALKQSPAYQQVAFLIEDADSISQ